MVKDNKYISHTQKTLVPGLPKSILFSQKVKEFEFYGYLRSCENSGCIKNFDIKMFQFETSLSLKTIKRRLQSLSSMGWISIIGDTIYIRSLRKVCEYLKCPYNEDSPRKKTLITSKLFNIKDTLRSEVLKDHIKFQEYNFKKNLKQTSKSLVKSFNKLGTEGFKVWLLNNPKDLKKHSDVLKNMDITASRKKCAELWDCSDMDASRSITNLKRFNVISDVKRHAFLKKGGSYEANVLKEQFNDPTIFHSKGRIYKKLNNKISFLKVENMERVKDSSLPQGKNYSSNFRIKLDMKYNSYLGKESIGFYSFDLKERSIVSL